MPKRKIEVQNDISGGNILKGLPIGIEKREADFSPLKRIGQEHPRLLIQSKDLPLFRQKVKENPQYCRFSTFLQDSVSKYVDWEPLEEPQAYPAETIEKASLWRPYWRKMYVDCQMAFNATRNLSLGGVILEEREYLEKAKSWLVKLAGFDPHGVTSRAYNDEAYFRVTAALAWGFDWLYNMLTADEREAVQEALIIRVEEIMTYLTETIDLLENPLNSHGVRSISSVVIPASIALYRHYEKAEEYLKYSINYYSYHYPPWGGDDGAWAEGPDYWNTAMAFVGEAFDLLKSYTSIDLFDKKFYKKTGDFILYCMPVHSKRASFCDQSSLGDYPGLKLGYNMRQFASLNQNPHYMWYFQELKKRDTSAHEKFYNYGWWDFAYDDLRHQYLWEEPESREPACTPLLKVFPQTGWAAFHSHMASKEDHIHLIFKSSPFGSISHSHGDQNAFTLHAFGETLASITGYYGGYGVDMHLKWRRQSHSKNLILIGGKGQYAENRLSGFPGHDDKYCLEAKGKISDFDSSVSEPFVEGDATEAYQFFNKDLISYKRKIWFVKGRFFVIRDRVKLKKPQDISWLLHSTFQSETFDDSFRIEGEKASLNVQFLSPGLDQIESITSHEGFGDVNDEEYKDLEIHGHVETLFKASMDHEIITLLIPQKRDQEQTKIFHEFNEKNLILRFENEEISILLD